MRTWSPRQMQILEMAAEGVMMDGMAGRLGISPRTVENHCIQVRRYLGAKNMTHAVAIAFRMGILS